MNLHVTDAPGKKALECLRRGRPVALADAYHVYGVDWDQDEISVHVDGVLVIGREHALAPAALADFDWETMPSGSACLTTRTCLPHSASSTCGRGRRASSKSNDLIIGLIALRPPGAGYARVRWLA